MPTLTQFRLHLNEGSIAFSCEPETAQALDQALKAFLVCFKDATPEAGPRPCLEFQRSGGVFFEVFCNPNIWANPFSAKVLVTIKDTHLRLSSEVELTQLRDDLSDFLAQI
jgi:hypothetical protein